MSKIEFELQSPVQGHEGPIKLGRLRQPTGAEYARIGDPVQYQVLADGGAFPIEHADRIKAYLDACVESPKPELLAQLGLADAMRFKEELLGFFIAARMSLMQPSTSSSSTSSSTPPPPVA